MSFDSLPLPAKLRRNAKISLLWFVENTSASYAKNLFYSLKRLTKMLSETENLPLVSINAEHIINFKATLSARAAPGFSLLSNFLRKWYALGLDGVEVDAVRLLEQMRIPGGRKGEAVRTWNSKDGPFTNLEFDSLVAAMWDGYDCGRLSLSDAALFILVVSLGQRPVQYAALKVCDVKHEISADGVIQYSIDMPRAKQRGHLIRDQFKTRLLHPSIGSLVFAHAKQVRKQLDGQLQDTMLAPLFPTFELRKKTPPGFAYHRTSSNIGQVFKQISNLLEVVSIRTGKLINVTMYRARRTIGTRAAAEGHGELVIAELLDHTDTQHVGVYVEAIPAIVERIDKAMALRLAPLAQAFAGRVINRPEEALRHIDPDSRISDPRFSALMRPMGNCGHFGFCNALAPIACYTCRSFEPWLDGPHEAVLDHLVSERDRLSANADHRVAAINDRTILAVAEVVTICKERRQT